jgi:hypothetical protein
MEVKNKKNIFKNLKWENLPLCYKSKISKLYKGKVEVKSTNARVYLDVNDQSLIIDRTNTFSEDYFLEIENLERNDTYKIKIKIEVINPFIPI